MIFFTNISIAFEALRISRTRTYLTMLGIIIGVASITFILAIGEGFKQAISMQVNSLHNNLVVARPGAQDKGLFSERGILTYSPLSQYATTTLTEQDYLTLQKDPSIQHIAPLMLINGSVRHKNNVSQEATILATSPDFDDTLKLETTEGQFLDDITNQDTVVIGRQLAIDLYGTETPIGEQLSIRGVDHTIIGILKTNRGPLGINGVDLNHAAIIHLDDGKAFNQGIAQIQQLNITPKNNQKETITSTANTLLKNHRGEKDFTVASGQEAASISKNFYQFITTLTAIVAGVSLIVGGVGIMNIMLVGVAERTREIGVRKSLGASNRHIMWQFLIEALIMSIVGGIIGLILGYGLALIASLLLGIVPIIHWMTIGVSLGLAVVIGVIFGSMPAFRAARKDPIEALRQSS